MIVGAPRWPPLFKRRGYAPLGLPRPNVRSAPAEPERSSTFLAVYTAAMTPIRIVIAVVAAVSLSGVASAGQPVRVPRDSPLVVQGVMRPITGGASPVAIPEPKRTTGTCPMPLAPDLDDRPLWIPDAWCWTGSESVRVPGHWGR